MRAVTLKEAKAGLNELVEAAVAGEQVVLMKGSKHVAAIIPISAADLELAPRLTDQQAERLWSEIRAERAAGSLRVFGSPAQTVEHLESPRRRPRTSSPSRRRR